MAPRARVAADRPTASGIVLFVICLLVAASAFEDWRMPLAGVQVHLYLLLLAPCLVYLLAQEFHRFPSHLFTALAAFWAVYVASTVPTFSLSELLKISASVATILAAALLVRRPADFRAGVLGLTVAVGLLAYFAVRDPDFGSGGVNPIDTGNKNTYSLYALPPLLFAGLIVTQKHSRHVVVNGALIICSFLSVLAIAMSANRSGWLGVLLVAVMVFQTRRARGALLVAALAVASGHWITNYGTTEVMERRIEQTIEGHESDAKRIELTLASLTIFLENPILGASPEGLPAELGHQLEIGRPVLPHNVFAHLIAGCGILGIGALVFLGHALWTSPELGRGRFLRTAGVITPPTMLRMMIVLWAVRGLFTHEILYAPSFCLGLGLAIGLCLVERGQGSGDREAGNGRNGRNGRNEERPTSHEPLTTNHSPRTTHHEPLTTNHSPPLRLPTSTPAEHPVPVDLDALAAPSLPFVSVVIPLRNEAAFVRALINQVLCQDYPRGRLEILVVNPTGKLTALSR